MIGIGENRAMQFILIRMITVGKGDPLTPAFTTSTGTRNLLLLPTELVHMILALLYPIPRLQTPGIPTTALGLLP